MDSTLFYANLNFRLTTPEMQLLHLKDHTSTMLMINVCEQYTIIFMCLYFMFISLATAGWIGSASHTSNPNSILEYSLTPTLTLASLSPSPNPNQLQYSLTPTLTLASLTPSLNPNHRLVGVLPAAVAIWSVLELLWKTNHGDIVPRLVAEG